LKLYEFIHKVEESAFHFGFLASYTSIQVLRIRKKLSLARLAAGVIFIYT